MFLPFLCAIMKKRVLFVCLGNICRSPSAEAVLRRKLAERGMERLVEVDSAGIGGWHVGDLPDGRMRAHAARRGYELTHRARKFYADADFGAFDLIVGMDEGNVRDLLAMAATEEERAKVRRLTDFCRRFAHWREVPDPYYGGADGFELVLDMLEDAADGLLDELLVGR